MRNLRPPVLIALLLVGLPACTEKPVAFAPPPPGGNDTLVSFAGDVQPLLGRQPVGYGCLDCHGNPGNSNYSVRSYSTVFVSGLQAQALNMLEVRAGKPDSSYLIWKLEGNPPWPISGQRMPQNGPPFMSAADIATIRTWIRQGALDN